MTEKDRVFPGYQKGQQPISPRDGQTGRLIEERNFQGFIDAIVNPGIDSATIEKTVALNFDWKKISEDYRKEFEKIIAN